MRQETQDRKHETGDIAVRQETKDKRQEPRERNKRQEIR